eukprot:13445683-Alexandrium_andersonii.AAC.1
MLARPPSRGKGGKDWDPPIAVLDARGREQWHPQGDPANNLRAVGPCGGADVLKHPLHPERRRRLRTIPSPPAGK